MELIDSTNSESHVSSVLNQSNNKINDNNMQKFEQFNNRSVAIKIEEHEFNNIYIVNNDSGNQKDQLSDASHNILYCQDIASNTGKETLFNDNSCYKVYSDNRCVDVIQDTGIKKEIPFIQDETIIIKKENSHTQDTDITIKNENTCIQNNNIVIKKEIPDIQDSNVIKEKESYVLGNRANIRNHSNFGHPHLNIPSTSEINDNRLSNDGSTQSRETNTGNKTTESDQTIEKRLPPFQNQNNRTKEQHLFFRMQIIERVAKGMPLPAIAKDLGIAKKTVYKWVKRWQELGNLQDLPRSGKPRMTSIEEDKKLIDIVKSNPSTNVEAIKTATGIQCCTRTIERRLRANKLHCHLPAGKDPINKKHQDTRLKFAQKYINHDLDFWGRVIFTDNKMISMTPQGHIQCVGKNSISKFEETENGHVTSRMWGWVHLHGVGELVEISRKFTSDQYLEILEEVMLPSVRSYAIPYPERIIVMQDRYPMYTARRVIQWFEERPDIELLEWPNRGCDMNPLETVWADIVKEWKPQQEQSREQIIKHCLSQWDIYRRNSQLIYDIVSSVPTRLKAVIETNGSWSKY